MQRAVIAEAAVGKLHSSAPFLEQPQQQLERRIVART
jgi:hypothetical protein